MLLDRAARLPLCFPLPPAHRHDLPFAYPLWWVARCLCHLPLHVVRADGPYWGQGLVQCSGTSRGAQPIRPCNRKQHPLARVRQRAAWPLSYAARARSERCLAVAKRYYHLATASAVGWDAVLRRVTLTCCALLGVAWAAHQAGAPELRLSPSRVLAHYLPVEEAL